jgi:hypothetical protein
MNKYSINENWCGTYKLDENKNAIPCSVEEWGEQLEEMRTNHTKHVADEDINGKRVSTVWLGLDHQWDENAPPHIYETMVFEDKGYEIYCSRYSTWKEAEEGHQIAVQWVRDGCKEEDEKHE